MRSAARAFVRRRVSSAPKAICARASGAKTTLFRRRSADETATRRAAEGTPSRASRSAGEPIGVGQLVEEDQERVERLGEEKARVREEERREEEREDAEERRALARPRPERRAAEDDAEERHDERAEKERRRAVADLARVGAGESAEPLSDEVRRDHEDALERPVLHGPELRRHGRAVLDERPRHGEALDGVHGAPRVLAEEGESGEHDRPHGRISACFGHRAAILARDTDRLDAMATSPERPTLALIDA